MRLRSQLRLAFLLMALVSLALGAAMAAGTLHIRSEYEGLVREAVPTADALQDLRAAGLEVASATHNFALLHHGRGIENRTAEIAEVGNDTIAAEARLDLASRTYADRDGATREGSLALRARILDGVERLEAKARDVRDVARGSGHSVALFEAQAGLKEAEAEFHDAIGARLELERAAMDAGEAAVDRAIALALVGLAAAGALGGGVAVFVADRFARAIAQPLQRLDAGVKSLAERRDGVQVEPGGSAETKSLARAFNDMSERLARSDAELARYHAEAIRKDRLSTLGTLVAGVAHEVNNPLAYIRSNVELAEDALRHAQASGTLPPESRRELAEASDGLRVSLTGIDRVAAIVRSLRAVARTGGGQRAPTNLAAVAADAVAVAHSKLPDGVRVETETDGDPLVHAAREEVVQVVLNLVLNAAVAMQDREGTIRVRVRREDGRGVVEVEDEGCGIDEDAQTKIFQPFFTTRTDGTGLGLSISQRIAHDHGGLLTFTTRPGQGTTFRLELPATPAEAARPS